MGRAANPTARRTTSSEKPPVRIPEAKHRSAAGAASLRFGRGGRPEAAGKAAQTPPDPGTRRVPAGRSEARSGHPAAGRNLGTCQIGQTPAAT